MTTLCEDKWRPDSKDRSWTTTRVEIWVVMDSKSETVAAGPVFVRSSEDMEKQIEVVLKHRDKDGFNMFFDNACDYTAFRVGALELCSDKFVFIPTDSCFIDYSFVKSKMESHDDKDTQQV